MPYSEPQYFESVQNTLISDELPYDREALGREHLEFLSKFTDEQLNVHDTIMSFVNSTKGKMFFVYGYGGTGKTFIWRSLSARIRSTGGIVLNVASSGIASLLFPGGRTTHSRFKIPINVNEDSMCNIKQGSDLAELIIRSKLIIRDEALMIHKHCIEAVDRTFRDILRVCSESSDGVVGGPNDGEVAIDLPSDIVLSNSGDPLKTIVESIYPSYMDPE
ncbi:uncharacterized protein LOC121808756 [Salvia splendens]|uniref:uncharacterized protein LOC121808756 n=1 Tax=Salvia splendens TaxID=180675 RepID=UPI001C27334D|nr:uncharacterized protein LOC121808756 [Salvia splendens]